MGNVNCCRKEEKEKTLLFHKKNNEVCEELKDKMNFKRGLPNSNISRVPIKPTKYI